jgi:hypothetical protein
MNPKEVTFFSLAEEFNQGMLYYLRQLSNDLNEANGDITGEATPSYLWNERAAPRIASMFPDIKLIVLLREPVARAYSKYVFKSANFLVPFETVVQLEFDALQRCNQKYSLDGSPVDICYFRENFQSGKSHGFLMQSMYYYQLKHWFRFFPRSQFLILQAERLFRDPQSVLQEVWDFLGVPRITPDDLDHNFLPTNYTTPIDPKVKKDLAKFFCQENKKLFQLLNREFDWDTCKIAEQPE